FVKEIPVVESDRGGKVTYHGPGQLIGYVVCDLRPNTRAVREHVFKLEETVIRALDSCGVQAEREAGTPGVWVEGAKIGALGVRIRQGVAYHGFAVNRNPDLEAFSGIVPCGLSGRPVTSLARLGIDCTRRELEQKIVSAFQDVFQVTWIREQQT
ncbi:MAG: lipoyl(octanoyl) transferase LipB, partial [Magnetococcus sp. YQC-5]